MTAPGEAGGRRCPVIPAAVTGRAPHVLFSSTLIAFGDRVLATRARGHCLGSRPPEAT